MNALLLSFYFMIVFFPYEFSVPHEFKGEYVRLQNNPKWKKIAVETNDQHLVFADYHYKSEQEKWESK